MDTARIAELLQPFFAASPAPAPEDLSFRTGFSPEESAFLSESQLKQISTYIDILLRWNARINLTSVRKPEEIVTRHFGESLFAARCLLPHGRSSADANARLIDVGSGAGFPGLPIKIFAPALHLALIESNHKKVAFLREVIRFLTLTDIDVFTGRGEEYNGALADVVTLRAVERFEAALPAAARLVAPGGRLALLIGEAQLDRTRELTPEFLWLPPMPVPASARRVLAVGTRQSR